MTDETPAQTDETGINYELVDTGLTTDEKIDEIRNSVRMLVDEVHKLTTYLMAPAQKPSAIDQLVAALAALTEETKRQGEGIDRIAKALDGLVIEEVPSTPPPIGNSN
jgi:hypothetical protein